MSYDPEPQIADYLRRLNRELRGLPRERRREVVNEIAAHIAQEQEAAPIENEADLLTLLDRIGQPEEIAAEASERVDGAERSTGNEIAAIVLLLVGGFILGVGWIVGVVLLWSSTIWTIRDKLIGTLIFPGGLAASTFVFFGGVGGSGGCSKDGALQPLSPTLATANSQCTGSGSSTAASIAYGVLVAVAIAGPIMTSIYLTRRLNRLKGTAPAQQVRVDTRRINIAWLTIIGLVVVVFLMFLWLGSQTLVPVPKN